MHPQIPNGIIESEVIVLAFEIDQTKESWTDYTDILSINEMERAQEFYYPEDKLRFSKCRSILRNALSKWGDDPEYQRYRESVPAIFPLLRTRG